MIASFPSSCRHRAPLLPDSTKDRYSAAYRSNLVHPVHPCKFAGLTKPGTGEAARVVDPNTTRCYRFVLILQLDADGLLPSRIHRATWDEVAVTSGDTPPRRLVPGGLGMAIYDLRRADCRTVYIDGSFVTNNQRLTQKELADRLALKEQQIPRYEATDYAAANWSRFREVAEVLSMELGGAVRSVGVRH